MIQASPLQTAQKRIFATTLLYLRRLKVSAAAAPRAKADVHGRCVYINYLFKIRCK